MGGKNSLGYQSARGENHFKLRSKRTLATARRPITAAAIPNPTSSPLIRRTGWITVGRGASAGATAGADEVAGRIVGAPVEVGGRATCAVGAPEAGGRKVEAGVAEEPATPIDDPGVTGLAEPGEPAAGSVGNLIVGEALGLGGKLIRTVSFLGCILAASPGLGGAPLGTLGLFSAIMFAGLKLGLRLTSVKL